MSLRKSNELWELGEDLDKAQGLLDALQSRAEEEEEEQVPSPWSLPSLSSSSPSFSFYGLLGPPEEGSTPEGPQVLSRALRVPSRPPMTGQPGALASPSLPAPTAQGRWAQAEVKGRKMLTRTPVAGHPLALASPACWPQWPRDGGVKPPEQQEDEQPQGTFHVKTAALVKFLLLKYRTKQPTNKAEMLEVITPAFQDDFPVILSEASICLRLVLGLDVTEVDPREDSYDLNIVLGLTWDGMVSGQGDLPKTSLLVLVLGLIVLEDDCAPRRRDLLTNVWVQEGYLECRPVAGSDPVRYEFLWGPRAYEETTKLQVMDYVFQVSSSLVVSSLALCEQILR
uniref:melanoma-associated antigen 8-like n=1 Tax=Nyctereutes procyonoides TaxID=34880 RepID=UPI002444C988|nr:melanoma-associated antigen 8-like [Nyctereutes procyonoides]